MLVTDNVLKARPRHGFDREDSLIPNQVDTFLIDTWSTTQVFNVGHRLRVIISSSNYPRFEYSPNTGAPFIRNDPAQRVAHQKIFSSPQIPSVVILPVIPNGFPVVSQKPLPLPADPKTPLTVAPPSPLLRFWLPASRICRSITVYDAAGRWSGKAGSTGMILPFTGYRPGSILFAFVKLTNYAPAREW